MKNYLMDGNHVTVAAPADVTSGAGVLKGATFGIALHDALSGEDVTIVRRGVVEHAKSTGASTGGAQGAKAYWDNTAKKFTAVSTSNTLVGSFAATCADGDATCQVILDGAVR